MPTPLDAAGTCRVVLCRGCCCGTVSKHPDTDHQQQAEQLRQAPGVDLTVTGCLGNCERSNTVVVAPSRAGRAAGGRATWFGRILDPQSTQSLAQWIAAGGPGLAEIPAELAERAQPPGRRLDAEQRAGAR
ncbi:(2Fe-2S) ferredoxin domain-containing protein [Catellatospora sichuanensis]|uniref:(2Fe-2S) ferredoxin domain-containing protein n=1 Tax=Catellatospora sichuanensis TaxID=1969805 RepID=UPI00118247C1|nr:(2Fe-2S) ferredoxin domain-containing protein [Catellatospora sichuanensis]